MKFYCLNCGITIEVLKIRCGVIRCGIHKNTGRQLNPHAKDRTVKRYLDKGLLYGCGYQMKIVDDIVIPWSE